MDRWFALFLPKARVHMKLYWPLSRGGGYFDTMEWSKWLCGLEPAQSYTSIKDMQLELGWMEGQSLNFKALCTPIFLMCFKNEAVFESKKKHFTHSHFLSKKRFRFNSRSILSLKTTILIPLCP